jgi:hypothetical protein
MRGINWIWRAGVVVTGLLWVCPVGAAPTTALTVTGDVTAPTTFTLSNLSSLPALTESVTYQTLSGPQSGAFTGPNLWYLLNNAVGLRSPPVKNGVLRQYVVAAGSDGYTSVFSLGELDPIFGGSSPQGLIG